MEIAKTNFLDDIIETKKGDLERLNKYYPLKELKEKVPTLKPVRDFLSAVSTKGGPDEIRIIAEVKRASPSKGVLRADFYPFEIARTYQLNGAAAVSVVTEEKHFLGRLDWLEAIKRNLKLPVLRKDFIIDEYQVYESRINGADAVLLIAAILSDGLLNDLMRATSGLGMVPLVEVHNEEELERASKAGARLIGINNRDLRTFKVDINTTIRLAPKAPEGTVIVSESGISTKEEIDELKASGVSAFLIGETFITQPDLADVGRKLKELRGAS